MGVFFLKKAANKISEKLPGKKSLEKIFSDVGKVVAAPANGMKNKLNKLIVKRGATEFKFEARKAVTTIMLGSILRWIYFILVMITAHAFATVMELNTQLIVALGIIVGIYGYYVLLGTKFIGFCADIWRRYGFICNPLTLIYLYIFDRVISQIKENAFTRYTAYLFFTSKSKHMDDLAGQIIRNGIKDKDLQLCVAVRALLYITGWVIYIIGYEKIFFFATGIDFNHWYEPIIWPFWEVGAALR